MLRIILSQLAPLPQLDPVTGGGNLDSYQLNPIEITGCFCYNLFVQPFKLVNFIACEIIDVVLGIIPQTPTDYHLGSILQNIATNSPLMWSLSGGIVSIVGPMLLIIAAVKFWKIFKPI